MVAGAGTGYCPPPSPRLGWALRPPGTCRRQDEDWTAPGDRARVGAYSRARVPPAWELQDVSHSPISLRRWRLGSPEAHAGELALLQGVPALLLSLPFAIVQNGGFGRRTGG
ncbi:hypothetical protein P7K49_025621 [Saguinus oedipus]|uniref:Uncharacterized protein n=1 Tax=Saguinus oedipus TaxID=9490 RepID=A0ABQ9UHP0_SAGOE|nr:hypothetical protein P7K49_025621 [Saguinus oedipus]